MERKIKAAQKDGGLSRDAAVEEVVADACEMVLGNSKAVERLAKEKPGLAKRIADWLHEFFADIRKAFEGVDARHEEAKAMLDYMDELTKLWDDALVEAAENRGETKKGSSTKFSYAGRKSKSADQSLLKTAEEMEKQGKSSEQIRKETGWFRGMDGEWRYEINDADIQFNRSGFFSNPDIVRFNELNDKFILGEITEKEASEARELAKSLEGVRKSPEYLNEYIKHDSLFKAYPDLKSVKVVFDDLEGERGHYSPKKNEIVVSSKLKSNDELLKDTIVHEIQHAIQQIEGFSGGASPTYWDAQMRSGYDARTKSERAEAAEIERQYHQVKEDPEFFEDASQLVLSRPTVPIEVDNAEWLEYYKNWNELYEKYGERLKEFVNLYDRVLISQTRTNRNAYDLYMDTAGEIEARDVSRRRSMDAEQRKNTRPDIDREDVVFARSGDSYSILRTKKLTLKEQLKEYYSGKFKSSDSFYFGETPEVLNAIGIENGPLAMPSNSFKKSVIEKHNIPRRVIKNLSEKLKNPILSFYDDNSAGIVIDDIDGDGKPVLVAIEKFAIMDRKTVNSIRSIYGLDSPLAWIMNQSQNGKKFYAFDKERADLFLQTYGYKASVGGIISSSGDSILHHDTEVKKSRRDSAEGLTKEEARAQAAAYTRLKAENAELRRRLEYWKGQTRRTKQATVRQADVNRFALQLIKRYGSTADQATIRQALQEMGDYLVQNDGEAMDYDQLRQMAVTVAAELVATAEATEESGYAEDVAGEILSTIWNTDIRQTAATMKDKAAKQGSADVISELFRKEQT